MVVGSSRRGLADSIREVKATRTRIVVDVVDVGAVVEWKAAAELELVVVVVVVDIPTSVKVVAASTNSKIIADPDAGRRTIDVLNTTMAPLNTTTGQTGISTTSVPIRIAGLK